MCAMGLWSYLNEGLKGKLRGHTEIGFEGLANVIVQSNSAYCHF